MCPIKSTISGGLAHLCAMAD